MHSRKPGAFRIAAGLVSLASVIACGPSDQVTSTNRKPNITVDQPTDGQQSKPGALFVQLTATDPDPTDASEELSLELKVTPAGGSTLTLTCEGGATRPAPSGLFTCTSVQTFDVGQYTFTARARDPGGTYSDAVTLGFDIRNDNPVCLFRTPASGSTTSYDEEVPTLMILACEDPDGEISRAEVCIDSDLNGRLGCDTPASDGTAQLQVEFNKAGIHTVTATVTDEDGGTGQDSFTASVSPCEDEDGDGYYPCDSRDPEAGADCDDLDALAYPGNPEVCDDRDNDCDGEVDNIQDLDGDGYLCDDCDNRALSIHPGAPENCNGKDDDCDATTDEDFDLDGDGYKTCALATQPVPDCDDATAGVNPGAAETCNAVDDDCDRVVDDKDDDDDAYVDSACTSYTGANGGDCDDANPGFNPGITEVCDNHDEDCDGRIDNDTPCFDDDGDGFCEASCTNGDPDGDCDDTFAWTYPDAVERFDWRDNDCDGDLESPIISIELAWLLLDGYSASGQAGKSLAGGGDVNGDDIDDLVIGAPNFDASGGGQQKGAAFVVHGRSVWDVGTPLALNSLPLSYRYEESQSYAQAGESVTVVGDMNGDKYADFAVGAPKASTVVGGVSFPQAGVAYILLGKASGWGNGALSSAITRVDGLAEGVLLGTSVSGGDVNGDGLPDLVVGGPQPTDGVTTGAGWAFVFPGRYSGYPAAARTLDVFRMPGSAGQAMGREVAVIGKHDGDGVADFLIAGDADASNRGIVQRVVGDPSITSGNQANIGTVANGTWAGKSTGEEVGGSLSGKVDIDNNCYDDFLIGRTYLNVDVAEGMAYAVFGKNGVAQDDGYAEDIAGVKFIPQPDDNCPCTVAGVGDMNGDGIGDFAIAAAHANVDGVEAAGRVYLFYGRDGRDGGSCEGTTGSTFSNPWPAEVDVAAEADGIFLGTTDHQRIGFTLAGLGDVNGDGYDDLGIGAPFYSPSPSGSEIYQAGRVYVQLGSPTP